MRGLYRGYRLKRNVGYGEVADVEAGEEVKTAGNAMK
jgi:hypothetical protein